MREVLLGLFSMGAMGFSYYAAWQHQLTVCLLLFAIGLLVNVISQMGEKK